MTGFGDVKSGLYSFEIADFANEDYVWGLVVMMRVERRESLQCLVLPHADLHSLSCDREGIRLGPQCVRM